MGSKVYDDTMRFDDPLQFVRNLLGYTFLHREATRIFAHNARELREADDLLLTEASEQRSELDSPFDDLHRGNVLGAIHAFTFENDLDIGITIIAVGHTAA